MEHNCHVDTVQKIVTAKEREVTETILLAIQGMGCPNCAMRVYNSLIASTGVISASVNHIVGIAQVTFNPNLIGITELLDAIAKAGNDGRHSYSAIPITA